MKNRLWLNVVLLAAVVALALFAYFKPQATPPAYHLSTLAAPQIEHIKIEIPGIPAIDLVRSGAEWKLTAPFEARADAFQVQNLLAILTATTNDRLPATELARYDLDPPLARVTLNGQTFSFGAINEMTRQQYVQTEDGVYLVALVYGTGLPKTALQLTSKQLFSADEIPVAFTFKNFKVVQTDGKWQITPPGDAGADDITHWVEDWRLASALAVLPASNRPPASTIAVKLKTGAEITLAVVSAQPQLVIRRSDQKFERQFTLDATQHLLIPPGSPP